MADHDRRRVVAAVQMGYATAGRDATIEKALGFIDEAASQGAELIVLPEVFNMRYDSFVGPYDTRTYELAEPIPGPTIERIASKAKQRGVYIVAPIFERGFRGSTTTPLRS